MPAGGKMRQIVKAGGGGMRGSGIRGGNAGISGGASKAGGSGMRGGGAGKSGGPGMRRRGASGSTSTGVESGELAWIHMRGHRIGRAGLRINANGGVYVPDSEDEDSVMGMEVEADSPLVVAHRADDVVLVDGAAGVELAPEVAADGATGMELAPKVAARLEMVLASIEPLYHDVFISIYKVLVPAFFKRSSFAVGAGR